jgi:hypothetical protein
VIYDTKNWFWVVAGSLSFVFSSAIGDYLPITDPGYQAWVARGGVATPIDTPANLGAVLASALARPINAEVLDGYQSAQAQSVIVQTIFKLLFNHENRLRAIERTLSLNNSPPNVAPAQAFAAVKALL